jgi:hypothetical protein
MTYAKLVEAVFNDPGWIMVQIRDTEHFKRETDLFLIDQTVLPSRENIYFDSTTDPADKFILVM